MKFKILKLDINESYFLGEVKKLEEEEQNKEYKINIQNERRGKVVKLPFGIIPKKDKLNVRLTGPGGIFIDDNLPYKGESEWVEIDSDKITYFIADNQDRFDKLEIIDE